MSEKSQFPILVKFLKSFSDLWLELFYVDVSADQQICLY